MAGVSKQTVYRQFESKEALFVGLVRTMTGEAADRVQKVMVDPADAEQLQEQLLSLAKRQLSVVLTPRLLQLRRLAIAEASRFPELGREVYEGGPGRAIAGLAAAFERWSDKGLLRRHESAIAASQFNWLVMAELSTALCCSAMTRLPDAAEIGRHAEHAVSTFLKAYAS